MPASIINHYKNNHTEIDISVLKKLDFAKLKEEYEKQSQELGYKKYTKEPMPIRKLEVEFFFDINYIHHDPSSFFQLIRIQMIHSNYKAIYYLNDNQV